MASVGEDVEKLEPSDTADGNVKWCSHFRKQPDSSSKSQTWSSISITQQLPTARHEPKRNRNMPTQKLVHEHS